MTLIYASTSGLDPIDELARLRDAAARAFAEALTEYVEDVAREAMGETSEPAAALAKAEALAERMAEARAFADVLGRLRVLRELGIRADADPARLPELVAERAGEPGDAPFCEPIQYTAPHSGSLSRVLGVGFEEAIADLMRRAPVLADNREEVRAAYEAHKFTFIDRVTAATRDQVDKRLALVQQVRDRIAAGLESGEALPTVADFLAELHERFTRPYADTVFRTNMATAYAAGRHEQATKLPGVVGFEYQATRDSSVRPNHLACDGIVAATDDPVWDHITPPCGFSCRCSLALVTRRQAEERGLLNADGELPRVGFPVPGRPDAKPDDEGFGKRSAFYRR